MFVLKQKGNCPAKPLILLLVFNQARTIEMQMLMTVAEDNQSHTDIKRHNKFASQIKLDLTLYLSLNAFIYNMFQISLNCPDSARFVPV